MWLEVHAGKKKQILCRDIPPAWSRWSYPSYLAPLRVAHYWCTNKHIDFKQFKTVLKLLKTVAKEGCIKTNSIPLLLFSSNRAAFNRDRVVIQSLIHVCLRWMHSWNWLVDSNFKKLLHNTLHRARVWSQSTEKRCVVWEVNKCSACMWWDHDWVST